MNAGAQTAGAQAARTKREPLVEFDTSVVHAAVAERRREQRQRARKAREMLVATELRHRVAQLETHRARLLRDRAAWRRRFTVMAGLLAITWGSAAAFELAARLAG